MTKSTTLAVTPFLKTFTYNKNRLSSVSETYFDVNFGTDSFTYDTNGRITTHNYSSAYNSYNKSFVYDSFGQLIRENNKGLDKTLIYCYDNIGNITSVKTYAYTTAETPSGTYTTDTYTYDPTQTDRLTQYGYNNISYNSIGYPVSYEDREFVWTNGKLTRLYDNIGINSTSSSEDVRFTYNAYGQRTSKIYEYNPGPDYSGNFTIGVDTTYDYDSSGKLIREFRTEYFTESASLTRELIYLYDESGMIGVMYSRNGAAPQPYYYRRNPQGDVVAIYTEYGHRKAEYAYDAFGNCKVIQNASDTDIAFINPIRYRGYYYDTETKLYYLNARYYNPEWRRFISPDSTEYIDSENPNGLNLYAYCCNDPINYADPSGHAPKWLQGLAIGLAIVGAVLVVGAVTVLTCGVGTLAGTLAGAVIYGAAQGIAIGATVGVVGGGIVGGIASDWSAEGILTGMGIGLGAGAIVGGVIGGFAGASGFTANSAYITQYGGTPKDVKDTLAAFKGNPKLKNISSGTKVNRYWGGKAHELGRWVSPNTYSNPINSLALDPVWGNTASNVSTFVFNQNATVLVGRVAAQGALSGGGIQWFVGNLSWLTLL